MKRLAILLLAFCAASGYAFDFGELKSVGLHGISRHDPNNDANNVNLGVFAETDKGFVAGTYYNSWYRQSWYAGISTPEWYRIKLSLVGITGYFSPVTVVVVPTIRIYQFDNGPAVQLSGGPKLDPSGQSVQHISLVWTLR